MTKIVHINEAGEKMSNRRKKYDIGNVISVKITMDTDEKTLEWINQQRNINRSVLGLIEQYANGELLHIEAVSKMLAYSNASIGDYSEGKDSPPIEYVEKGELDKQPNDNVEDNIEDDMVDINNNIKVSRVGEYQEDRKKSPTIPHKKLPFAPPKITRKASNTNS